MSMKFFKQFGFLLLSIVSLLFVQVSFAQTTNPGIFFQAVAKDNYSNPAKDRKIYVQSSILQATATGSAVLTEIHETTSDAAGVFSISIGQGTRTGGSATSLSAVPWAQGPFFLSLKIAITPTAPIANWDFSKDFIDLGTTPFGTVPYALYAGNSGAIDSKVNVADSNAIFVTPTQLNKRILGQPTVNFDTTNLSSRINLKANSNDLAALTNIVTSNTNSISSNTVSITANSNNLNILNSNVAANTASITSNTADIASNTNAISILNTSITSNTNRISSNTVSITANMNNLNILNTNVAAHTASITSNTADIVNNSNAISVLNTKVASNTNSITSNTASISSNTNDLNILSTNVAANTASITSNTANISNNTNAISLLNTNVASNTNSITSNTSMILANENAIALKAPLSSPIFNGTVKMTGQSTGYVGFVASSNAGSTTYTLPSSDGVSGQLLSTNGAGQLSWINTSAAAGNPWLIDGNTNGAVKTLGTNDAYALAFETNNSEKMRIQSDGTVGINTSSTNSSAILDVASTNKGFLPPRVALTSIYSYSNAINSPATGLLVYNTATSGTFPGDVTPGYYYFNGTKWVRLLSDPDYGFFSVSASGNSYTKVYLQTQDNAMINGISSTYSDMTINLNGGKIYEVQASLYAYNFDDANDMHYYQFQYYNTSNPTPSNIGSTLYWGAANGNGASAARIPNYLTQSATFMIKTTEATKLILTRTGGYRYISPYTPSTYPAFYGYVVVKEIR